MADLGAGAARIGGWTGIIELRDVGMTVATVLFRILPVIVWSMGRKRCRAGLARAQSSERPLPTMTGWQQGTVYRSPAEAKVRLSVVTGSTRYSPQ